MAKIIVYTKTGCGWCAGVLDLLRDRKINFEERNVTDSKEYFNEMEQKSGQTKAPTLEIDGEIVPDTDADAVARLLEEKKLN